MTNAISVKDRLKKQAIEDGKTMQDKLVTYGLERTIYRLSVSNYVERFTLKGGIFLYALFNGEYARATMDIDLLAQRIPNDAEEMKKVFNDIFSIECDDALRFDLNTLEVINITEFKEYHGVNVSIMGYLDRTKVPVSIDIGFGDVVYPERVKMEFPVLLDMEVPQVYAYSIYSVIAEKFEAFVSLGLANGRYKDFYDIYVLADRYNLNGVELKNAIVETFTHRGTGLDDIAALAELMNQMGVLTEVDMAAFAAYCQSYARWKEAQEHITSEGSTFETDKGYQKQTPWIGIANTNQKLMLQAASEFGLTPSSRSRIVAGNAKGKEPEDEMEALLGGDA